jgi:DNA-binding MarR family transcriptional regulator
MPSAFQRGHGVRTISPRTGEVDKSQVSITRDGLASYRPNPAHQRAKLLQVTPTGRAALHRMQAAYTQLALRTTEGLDSERLDLARETLSELQRRLESELP